MKEPIGADERRRGHPQHLAQRVLPGLLRYLGIESMNRVPQPAGQHHVAKSVPLGRRLAGREMRPMPDRVAQRLELLQGGVFDDGFVEGHFSKCRARLKKPTPKSPLLP